jgi:hypothetical protein
MGNRSRGREKRNFTRARVYDDGVPRADIFDDRSAVPISDDGVSVSPAIYVAGGFA